LETVQAAIEVHTRTSKSPRAANESRKFFGDEQVQNEKFEFLLWKKYIGVGGVVEKKGTQERRKQKYYNNYSQPKTKREEGRRKKKLRRGERIALKKLFVRSLFSATKKGREPRPTRKDGPVLVGKSK